MGKLENILLDMGFRGQEDRSRSPASPGRVSKSPVRIPGSVTQHDILVGTGVLGELKNYLGRLKLSRDVLIISSPTIDDLYGAKVDATLKAAGCWVTYALFPDGEEPKTI